MTILDEQVEAALAVWFEPNWPALVELSTRRRPHQDHHPRSRRATTTLPLRLRH
jgi:hypothetical protein